jgi:hypothetical protein
MDYKTFFMCKLEIIACFLLCYDVNARNRAKCKVNQMCWLENTMLQNVGLKIYEDEITWGT